MTFDPIAERVLAAIADTKRVPVDSVTPEATFEQLKIDSLDALNFAFALEEEFHISIPDEQLRELKTVGDAIEGVRRLCAASEATAS